MKWNLRYAPHLGYRPPFLPMFSATVGSADPVDQIGFAADRGFAGVLYAAARSRDASEQMRVGEALARHGLEPGCILYTTFDQLRNISWGNDSAEARAWIAHEMQHAIAAAERVGARRLAVLGGADPHRPLALQLGAFVVNLREAADIAGRHGLTLCLETVSRKRVAGMLLEHITDAYAIIKAANHPAVRLIFDTSHVQSMDGDLLFHLDQTWDAIEIVQLVDNPGRFEPGSGEINFESVLRKLAGHGYTGLVELEYDWRTPGLPSEKRGLETLRRLDAAAFGS
ncbi:sugar phosphate isomerase/epimerase family protein [Burkholderia sp. Ac-20353]|uniref:sugar phosphate isomerase/epimerase family protein n=1 Tax=Burkholderia sp. Ac-20353 TaxID=2703894 RepID=UPI00197B383A|nr:sugar phosphate isomerase/epimerase family protein [Burkholderia sp. Ac-20353]MBN3785530.1 TIM barrel protein [Burkholderia sp. Ac-20353]